MIDAQRQLRVDMPVGLLSLAGCTAPACWLLCVCVCVGVVCLTAQVVASGDGVGLAGYSHGVVLLSGQLSGLGTGDLAVLVGHQRGCSG